MNLEVITTKVSKSKYRCGECSSGRLDGKPCNPESCICRCHITGKRKSKDPILAGWKVPRSFDQEMADGGFGPVGPRRVK